MEDKKEMVPVCLFQRLDLWSLAKRNTMMQMDPTLGQLDGQPRSKENLLSIKNTSMMHHFHEFVIQRLVYVRKSTGEKRYIHTENEQMQFYLIFKDKWAIYTENTKRAPLVRGILRILVLGELWILQMLPLKWFPKCSSTILHLGGQASENSKGQKWLFPEVDFQNPIIEMENSKCSKDRISHQL